MTRRTVSIEKEDIMPDADVFEVLESVLEEFERKEDYDRLWNADLYYYESGWKVKLTGESYE